MPFAVTWIEMEIITLSESERERQTSDDITYIWNLKQGPNEPIYKRETESQTQRRDLWLPKGRGVEEREVLGVWDQQMQNVVYSMDKQQGPTVQCRKSYSKSCDKS